MLVDTATIHVRSGKGGDGCVSFRREKYVPKGGPDGGDGGDGGSVILVADPNVTTLLDFAGRHHWHAESGQPGTSKQQHGRNGEDLLVHVPPGTLVYDDASGELLVDLDAVGKRFVIAEGGKGGYGNERFKSSTNQTPRQSTPGEPAVEHSLRLELKAIADVGLVGKPNAGKSTLLSTLSRARPKIADYPFTTLQPQLGIAELSGGRRMVVADVPGLIEKAHEGHGLGTRFLRHIERTRVLVHLIELEPMDGSDPVQNYRVIRRELEAYAPALAAKPEIVALSKMDLAGEAAEDQATAVELIESVLGAKVMPISSATGDGINALLEACWSALGGSAADRLDGWPRAESGED
ncbi:GTPase ObgE [Phycisphaerales bacterium AB-hyl4]|uniref:GTPase Obg n=1 Tax=Natronomicrosphaera hydrolytica TaxID=3242702 RepID=A0ABV4U2Y2_9BACT